MRVALALAAASLACTAPAAPPPGAAGPLEAVQELSGALQRGDTATAWSLLSVATQKRADELAAAARAAAGDAGPESGKQMLFASALPAGKVDARLVDEKGDVARVSVSGRDYRVVRESGRWRVELELGRDAGPAR
jgi:hypothetical protein